MTIALWSSLLSDSITAHSSLSFFSSRQSHLLIVPSSINLYLEHVPYCSLYQSWAFLRQRSTLNIYYTLYFPSLKLSATWQSTLLVEWIDICLSTCQFLSWAVVSILQLLRNSNMINTKVNEHNKWKVDQVLEFILVFHVSDSSSRTPLRYCH